MKSGGPVLFRGSIRHQSRRVATTIERRMKEDAAALVRYDGAMNRWFLDPSFGRGYPADLVEWYRGLGLLDGFDLDAVAPVVRHNGNAHYVHHARVEESLAP